MKSLVLGLGLCVVGVSGARAQSAGHDLPRGFRSLAGVTLNQDSAATIRAKLKALLGRPTRRDADSVIYVYDTKEYMAPGSSAYETWNTAEYRESCFDAGPAERKRLGQGDRAVS